MPHQPGGEFPARFLYHLPLYHSGSPPPNFRKEELCLNELTFHELGLQPGLQRAIDEMGFDTTTSIQSQAIPLIKTGADVIGRSQTGTGKTIAFGIPALDLIDAAAEKNSLQVLILCPTRELAQQACDELRKLSAYMHGVRAVEVYGGVPMDRQIVRLKKANLVIGTPGRIMDHIRRRTLKLDTVKMVVLDEADEMLSMGFKEDIETILADTPAERQTVLFSATMPPAILALTREFQRDPQLIEIDSQHVTLDNIEQFYIDAPMGRKMDALNLLLRFHRPKLAMIFCNTKRMVDEVTEYLGKNGYAATGLHGDMNQSQRTKTMDAFKAGRVSILVATDVAARGIDVNGIETVINYDIPQSTEYYVHRIGRTGRAGRAGMAITICSGRRQVFTLRDIGRFTKSEIQPLDIPTLNDIRQKSLEANLDLVENILKAGADDRWRDMVNALIARGYSLEDVAAASLELHFGGQEKEIVEVKPASRGLRDSGDRSSRDAAGRFRKIAISIGRDAHCAPNHLVGAITDRTGISGGEIGKIEIYDSRSIVAIPAEKLEQVVEAMQGCKICGQSVDTVALELKKGASYSEGERPPYRGSGKPRAKGSYGKKPYGKKPFPKKARYS